MGKDKFVDLRPGVYTVTFTLSGFNTIRRDGIELSAGFTASVNADMRVGALEETITVSGASPMVDTERIIQQKVISRELLDSVPSSRTTSRVHAGRVALYRRRRQQRPGRRRDVYDSRLARRRHAPCDRRHAVEFDESRQRRDRVLLRPDGGRGIVIQLGGNSAEWELGGVQVNLIPKSGGNNFRGYFYRRLHQQQPEQHFGPVGSARRAACQHRRGRSRLRLQRLARRTDHPNKIWFFSAQRWWGNSSFVPGNYYNKDTSAWIYEPDTSRPAVNDNTNRHHNVRLTWQLTEKNKLNLSWTWSRTACATAP